MGKTIQWATGRIENTKFLRNSSRPEKWTFLVCLKRWMVHSCIFLLRGGSNTMSLYKVMTALSQAPFVALTWWLNFLNAKQFSPSDPRTTELQREIAQHHLTPWPQFGAVLFWCSHFDSWTKWYHTYFESLKKKWLTFEHLWNFLVMSAITPFTPSPKAQEWKEVVMGVKLSLWVSVTDGLLVLGMVVDLGMGWGMRWCLIWTEV